VITFERQEGMRWEVPEQKCRRAHDEAATFSLAVRARGARGIRGLTRAEPKRGGWCGQRLSSSRGPRWTPHGRLSSKTYAESRATPRS